MITTTWNFIVFFKKVNFKENITLFNSLKKCELEIKNYKTNRYLITIPNVLTPSISQHKQGKRRKKEKRLKLF